MKNFSENVRRKIFMITGGKCFYCGCDLNFDNFQVDHYKPKSNNGIDSKNRVPACSDCNLIKSNKNIDEFRETIENYLENEIHVRMINKHLGVKKREVSFYFERNDFELF